MKYYLDSYLNENIFNNNESSTQKFSHHRTILFIQINRQDDGFEQILKKPIGGNGLSDA
jgi:hypothetical protein